MMAVVLFSTAAALGVADPPAIATAADEWDIGSYDRCIQAEGDSTVTAFLLRPFRRSLDSAQSGRQQQR